MGKNIRNFEDFVNESYSVNEAYYGSYAKVVKKVYTVKNSYDKYDAESKQSNLAYDLRELGFDENITLAKLVKDPKFKDLPEDRQNDILKVAGTGRTPNAKFIKEFMSAMNNWVGHKESGHSRDQEDTLYMAASITAALQKKDEENVLYYMWSGLDYSDQKALKEKYKGDQRFFSWSEFRKGFSDDERKYLLKMGLPTLQRYAKNNFTDHKIERFIQEELKWRYRPDNSRSSWAEEYYFAGTSWTQPAMKNALDYLRKLLLDGSSIDWDKFKVKREMEGSKHGPVVSSSFTTTYYYTVELSMNGKTIKMKNVIGGSDHYSGGWN